MHNKTAARGQRWSAKLIWVLACAAAACCVTSGWAAENCHMREYDLCMASMVVFVQQPANAKVSEAEIEKQCALFKDTEKCIDEYQERCFSKSQDSLIDFMSSGMLKTMRNYCHKGHPLRASYLKHGDCVNKQRKNTNKCTVELQAVFEKAGANETHYKDRNKILCCGLDRMTDCNNKVIEPACGHEALEVSNMLMQGLFSRGTQVQCRKYKHNNAECKRLLPPPDTKPKGAKSNSALSKLMSTATS